MKKARTLTGKIGQILFEGHEYRTAAVVTLFFAIAYAGLEYYYIVPIEARPDLPSVLGTPIFSKFYAYHLFTMFPIFFLVAFDPFLDDLVEKYFQQRRKLQPEVLKTFILAVGNMFMAVWMEDVFWFIDRMLYPLKSGCLSGKWIQWMMHCKPVDSNPFEWKLVPGPEWTAGPWFGTGDWYLKIGQAALPYWYILVGIGVAVIYAWVFYFSKKQPSPPEP